MKASFFLTAAFLVAGAVAAPLPQLAGEGAACNSVLSSTDNGVGHGVENAEDNTAGTVSSTKAATRRQLAGEGAACDSVLSDTDNGVGHGVENAEDNTASTVSTTKASTPKTPATRRQLDKIANGAGNVGNAAGVGKQTGPVAGQLDTVDGQTTSDGATLGAQAGQDEETALENAGSQVPKRQLDKIANGAGNVGNAAGAGKQTGPVASQLDTVDGQTTSDGATLGAQAGQDEETALENAGSQVP